MAFLGDADLQARGGCHVGERPWPSFLNSWQPSACGTNRSRRPSPSKSPKRRRDAARAVADAGVLGLDEALRRVADEDALAGAVEEVGPAVAVDVGHRQMISLQRAGQAARSQAQRLETSSNSGGTASAGASALK